MTNLTSSNKLNRQSATWHWLLQRITALLLIPLSFRLVVFLDMCLTKPYDVTMAWLASAYNLTWIVLWLLVVFYHAAMGLQVVIEDYVADQKLQGNLIKLINLSFLALALVSLFFLFRSV